VKKEGPSGQAIEFEDLEPGDWTITTNAFFRGHGNLQANDPNSNNPDAQPKTVTLMADQTENVQVTLELAQNLKDKVLIADAATLQRIGSDWLDQGKTFLLLTDLPLSDWAGPQIHGDPLASPQGRAIFDGGGHTVRINSFAAGANNYGLFTSALWADISGLNIELNNVTASPADLVYAGGLVTSGKDVNIKDVHVSGIFHLSTFASAPPPPPSYAGGIAGGLYGGSIDFCSSTLNLKLENSAADSIAGGIVGLIDDVEVSNSYFTGSVQGEIVGGIAGQIIDAQISTSYFAGTVQGEVAGGIAGELDDALISDSFSSGTVEGDTAGGIAGQAVNNGGTIKHCYNKGTVQGTWKVGGIAGSLESFPIGSGIGGCYATGVINLLSPIASPAVGGIAGVIDSTGGINNCLVLDPAVSGASTVAVGRIAGINSGSGNLVNNSAVGGTFTQANVPITITNPPAVTDGETIASISAAPVDFDTDDPDSAFAVSPWDSYSYPVLSWQIDKGIRP
jgi:hypothetical protein